MIKKVCAVGVLSSVLLFTGCINSNLDPVATGEVIGVTYQLTKDQLNEGDRKNIEEAYSIFSTVLATYGGEQQADVKSILYLVADAKIEDPSKRAAVKLVITLYWNKLQTNVNIDAMPLKDQIEVLKQVEIGIKRGLGA
jgi:hypothetical protein